MLKIANLFLLFNFLVASQCQTCNYGNQSQSSSCSRNSNCECFQYSFSNSTYVCGLIGNVCSQFSPCQPPTDGCQVGEIYLRHPNCNCQPICYPLSMTIDQSCPPRTQASPNTFSETIQIYVPITGFYKLSSVSGTDAHGYLYNGTFDSSNPQYNFITHDDDNGGANQFKFSVSLQTGVPYTLVVTNT